MTSPAPKLRSDLVVREQKAAGETVFIVKDPVTGQFFNLREAERFIAGQCDGETSLDILRQRTEQRFGLHLPPETLAAFVRHLEKAALLETDRASRRRRGSHSHRRIHGSLLYLRFKLFDPDPLLDWLVGKVHFCFTPSFVALSAALILLAAAIVGTHWTEVSQSLGRLLHLSALPLFLAVLFLVMFAHELAHGLTCKRFGGEVREMGFMLIYLQPAFYCNVSDAWLFPEKRKRLCVGLAGPYFELFLWSGATLLWSITDVETWINYVAFIVMTGSGIATLLNFNPFIKLDGYYLLSDYLEVPNLRARSFGYVGGLLKRLLSGGPRTAEELPPRERRIYLSYGLVATVVSFFLLAYVLVKAGGFLIETHQPGAFVVSTGVAGIALRRRVRRLFGRPSDPSDDAGEVSSSTDRPAGPSEPERASRRSRRRSWKRGIRWTASAAAALAVLFFGRMELRVAGPFSVVPEENADVRAAAAGIVEKIYVAEGDEVEAGRAHLKKLEAGPPAEEIELAKAGVSGAVDKLEYARRRLTMLQQLLEQDLLSRKEFVDAQEQVATADGELVLAKGRLKLLSRGSRPEEIAAMRAQLDGLEVQRRHLEEERRLLNVLSPVTGIVATPSRQLKEMERQLVAKGTLIAKVYDFRTVTAQIMIPEKEIADVCVGQEVALRARAYPGNVFHGTVTSIATSAQGGATADPHTTGDTIAASGGAPNASRTIIVATQIANDSLALKPEMTGQAKVSCGQRRIADLMARRLARTFKVEVWSWW